MKYITLLFLIMLASCKQGFEKAEIIPSTVDSITTETEVKDYMIAIDTNYKYFYIKSIEKLDAYRDSKPDSIMKFVAKKLGITKNIYKEDFDNNGYTDLLILGGWSTGSKEDRYAYHPCIIMNYERKKTAKITSLSRNMHLFTLPQIVSEGDKPFLKLYSPEKMRYKTVKLSDTMSTKLTYQHGGFAEYNNEPIDNHIEKIEFEAGPCFGSCPMYKLTINKDQTATFLAEHYNFSKGSILEPPSQQNEGFFKGKIKKENYNNLIGLLNYIDFTKLKDEYSVGWTDDRTGDLKITYANGRTKTISDYGMVGTYGLKSVYELLEDMRFNQKWDKVPETTTK
jgi:hypothetical protein